MNKKIRGEAVMEELKTLQRLHKISSSYEEMRELLSEGLHSAYDIFQLGENEFVDRFSNGLGGVEPAKALYLLAHRFIYAEHTSKE